MRSPQRLHSKCFLYVTGSVDASFKKSIPKCGLSGQTLVTGVAQLPSNALCTGHVIAQRCISNEHATVKEELDVFINQRQGHIPTW